MPARASKNVHGRTSKNTPARNKQDPEPATPAVLAPPPPVVTSAVSDNEEDQKQAIGKLINVRDILSPIEPSPASIPFLEDQEDAIVAQDDDPPIPIPVPRSQTPQFVPSKTYDFAALAVASSDIEQLGVQHDRLIADRSPDPPTPSRPPVDSHPAFPPPHTLSVSPPPSPTPIAPAEPSPYSY
ncbi:hypothetical protein H0H92_011604, partial [Tricholoma furcatifolium]